MIEPGYYFGSHDGCAEYNHHRHPLTEPQPHEYMVTMPATATVRIVVDTDGTVRIRDADMAIGKDDVNRAEIQDQRTFNIAEVEDDTYEAMLDALPRDGEIALSSTGDWSFRKNGPILDAIDVPVTTPEEERAMDAIMG